MMFNPIIGMIHNVRDERWHPVVFAEAPLPGPPAADKPVRHKSKMHHTGGFTSREEALASARGDLAQRVGDNSIGPVRFALSHDFPWDGEGIPAVVEMFVESGGEMVPAFAHCAP